MKFTFIVQFGACYVRMPFLKSISGQNWFYLFANQRIQERTKISSLKFQYVLCYATMNTTQHNTQKKKRRKKSTSIELPPDFVSVSSIRRA